MIKKATRKEIKARNSFKGKRVFPATISTVFFLLFIEIESTATTKNNCICALGIATVWKYK